MLGIFLLGLLTRKGRNRANIAAMIISTALCLVLLPLIQYEVLGLGWKWLVAVGTAVTFALAYLLSLTSWGSESAQT